MYLIDACFQKSATIDHHESVARAAQLMRAQDVSEVVVTHQEGRKTLPLGIITDREIVVRAVAEDRLEVHRLRIGDLLGDNPLILGAFTPVEDAIRQMGAELVRRAPVVDCDGRLIGHVSLESLLDAALTSGGRSRWEQREWTTLMEY